MLIMAGELSSRGLRERMKASRAGIGRSSFFARARWLFFVYGFAKSEQDNIDKSDERDFKELAKIVLAVSDAELKRLIESGNYTEVKSDE